MDLAATGKTTTWTGIQTDRYEGGKLVESWVDWDKYSFLEGLGLVKMNFKPASGTAVTAGVSIFNSCRQNHLPA